MYRKDSVTVGEWLKNSNKALLVTGARQIGKTWLIRDEIEKSGCTKFEINFIDQPDMIAYLNAEMSAEEFLIKLRMIMPQDCKPHETVVFFDEIQKCPEIVTKIKFLVDEGSYKYVMSGSLLGVELKGIASAPVGYLTVLRMYPMDFEEFMVANSVSKTTLDMLKEKFETCTPVDEFIHQMLLSMFFVYLTVGGMPDAVKTYIETKDIREVDKVQRDIITLYKEDFSQYELEEKKLKLKSIYDIIPAETKFELINKNGEVNNGAHFGNAVAQQLTANGFEPYFCKKRNVGELDFVIEMSGKVVPIEVKSGKAYKAHKALNHFMSVPDYHIEKGYVFSVGNVETEGTVTYLPIYMCYLLKEKKIDQMIVDLDMEGL